MSANDGEKSFECSFGVFFFGKMKFSEKKGEYKNGGTKTLSQELKIYEMQEKYQASSKSKI